MCGITGFIDFNKQSNYKTLKNMTDVLYHRGPDDSGYSFYDEKKYQIGLGHRRLSILDLSKHGHQPMVYENYEIVYNGEIYNFLDIKKELERDGYIFSSDSDTEVLLKGYHKWGTDIVKKLNGMFAFVVYDIRLETIIVCRDEVGIKPLFYLEKDNFFAFASEVKSFNNLHLNQKILHEYMKFRFLNTAETFVKDIKVFPKGEIWTISKNNIKKEKFKFKFIQKSVNKKATKIVEDLLLDAIGKQIYADVPVGFFLSGGVDSSLLVSMASKYFKRQFNTYSVAFENYENSEHYYQKLVVNDSNTIHHNFISTHENYFTDYIYSTSKSDTPHLIPNYTQIYQLAKIAKKEVTVLLSGEGADELFGGYHRFSNTKLAHFINQKKLSNFLKIGSIFSDKFNKYQMENNSIFNFYRDGMSYARESDIKQYSKFKLGNKQLKKIDDLNQILAFDQDVYLHGLLQRVDNMTMLASIESRVPFLDQRLISFVNSLPFDKKVGFRNRKKMVYDIAKKYVPNEIITRPKVGFPLPLENWLCEDQGLGKLKYILLDEKSSNRELYNQDNLKNIFSDKKLIKKYSQSIIFPLVSLELWIRTFIEGENIEVYPFA